MSVRNVFSRRDFMRTLGAGALASLPVVRSAQAAPQRPGLFQHGVASGDPLADRVMIWTRITPPHPGSVPVHWEVALDAAFQRVIRRGRMITDAARDYTVKVDVLGLPAGAHLFYRFRAPTETSPAGRTRTLPVGHVSEVRLAVFTCSNYPAGYFHPYAEAARRQDVFAAVHLGDYIYEYAQDGYASEDAARLGRLVDPATELLSLSDYRRRYALYRTDPDLQALHAAMPMIVVWDDHEISNDAWRDGAENHDPATEGDYLLRRAAAVRAYHEWMPTRVSDPTRPEQIYRGFQFGDLLALHMLDTRVIGRDRQLDYGHYLGAAGFDRARFIADLTHPQRQLLGAAQSAWLGQRMVQSSATWDLLGQQVLMARMDIPAPLVLGQISFTDYSALLVKAQRAPASLTAQERALLAQPAIPYNLDAWDGYFMAREQVLGTARALDKNLVVLAGDTHNAWASELRDVHGRAVGVEFATPSVSSPGLETYFPQENPLVVAAGLTQIIGPLKYANTHQRGFMVVTARHHECSAQWHYVDSVKQPQYVNVPGPTLRTLPGAGNRTLIGGGA